MKKELYNFLVGPENTLKEVMQKIDINGYGIALVVDDNIKLIGLITDGDIRRAIIKGTDINTPIQKITNRNPMTVLPTFTPTHISSIVQEKRLRHLPVINERGIVQDLLLHEEINSLLQGNSILFSQKKIFTDYKKVLVVGGAGYIGSVLVRQLLNRGYTVTVLDKLLFGKSSLQQIESHPHFFIIEGDTSHLDVIMKAIKNVDAVIHLAEIVGDPACALDPEKTQQMNYLCTVLIAQVCKHFQINRFIYASSCSVYGAADNDNLLTEESSLSPVSLYARMKIESEKYLLKMADGFFSPTILRLGTVFGESPRMRFDLVINSLTLKAVKDRKITIFGGDQWRPNIHVSDVGRAIMAVLEAPLDQVGGEIFNVGSDENNFTINQIGEFVKESVPMAELIMENKNIDKRNYRVNFSKINSTLRYRPLIGLKKGIQEIIAALEHGKYTNYYENIYYNDKWYSQQLEMTDKSQLSI